MTENPRKRILLVEDELLNRELVHAVLDRAHAPVLQAVQLFEAGTLAEARSVLSRTSVDIVLLDIQLPDGNGLELAEEILRRRTPERPGPMIIALTAGALVEQRAAAIGAGCDRVITKPYTAAELEAGLTGEPQPVPER